MKKYIKKEKNKISISESQLRTLVKQELEQLSASEFNKLNEAGVMDFLKSKLKPKTNVGETGISNEKYSTGAFRKGPASSEEIEQIQQAELDKEPEGLKKSETKIYNLAIAQAGLMDQVQVPKQLLANKNFINDLRDELSRGELFRTTFLPRIMNDLLRNEKFVMGIATKIAKSAVK